MWLLLGASIVDYLPNNSQQSMSQGLNKSSNPEGHPSNLSEYTFPSTLNGRTARESTPSLHRSSPARGSVSRSLSRMPSSSASRRLTPVSSTSSSPRHPPISLPPMSPRRASFFSRRDSADAGTALGRSIRAPSLSASRGGPSSLGHSASPSEKSTPRYVGEGALDDDSDTPSESDGEGDETAGANSSDEGATSKPYISPGMGSNASVVSGFKTPATTPSPLSRVTGRRTWSGEEERGQDNNDEDDSSSPSPQSTSDTETDSQGSSPRRPMTVSRSRSRSNSHSGKHVKKANGGRIAKSRSRSSTVASLAAPLLRPKPLTHQESCSSIRTVTAGEASFQDQYTDLMPTEVDRFGPRQDSRLGHNRQKSVPISDLIFNPSIKGVYTNDREREGAKLRRNPSPTERRIEYIRADDKRIREAMLSTLKKALEDLAEEVYKRFRYFIIILCFYTQGDVQMCCMLSLVAPDELGISRTRSVRFLDAYIGVLGLYR